MLGYVCAFELFNYELLLAVASLLGCSIMNRRFVQLYFDGALYRMLFLRYDLLNRFAAQAMAVTP